MFCTNCGNNVEEGTRFCTKCGTPIKVPTPVIEETSVVEDILPEIKVEDIPEVTVESEEETPVVEVQPEPISVVTPQPTPQVAKTVAAATKDSQKKNNNTGLIIAIVAIVVALVACIGAYVLVQSGVFGRNDSHVSDDRDNEDRYNDDEDYDDEEYYDDEDASDYDDETNVDFNNVDVTYITTYVLPAFASTYNVDGAGEGFALVYYNTDLVPEMYIFATAILYEFNADGTVSSTDISRAELLVRGIEVATLIKSETVEDAYAVLTDPNYSAMVGAGADYILPTSNVEYLTREDIEHLTPEQCRFARNEIYARNGRRFLTEDLQYYFDAKDWYEGTIEAEDFNDQTMLNEYEKANATLILEYEKEMGYLQ